MFRSSFPLLFCSRFTILSPHVPLVYIMFLEISDWISFLKEITGRTILRAMLERGRKKGSGRLLLCQGARGLCC